MQRSRKTDSAGRRDRKKELQREMDRLEEQIRRFQIDFRRFFAGDLPLPPEGQKDRISDQIQRLRSMPAQGVAERFRRRSLEAKYNSFLELFGRQLRDRERSSKSPQTGSFQVADLNEGVVVKAGDSANGVEALYKGLYLSSGKRNPGMDLERFRAYIDRQAEAIRSKTGCSDIVFRVAVEDGKTKLKARPVRKASA